jgi:L,D-peptidoglycan transpeptidase YkuD (ErfK/YbiS/YcfS/YnhG family)
MQEASQHRSFPRKREFSRAKPWVLAIAGTRGLSRLMLFVFALIAPYSALAQSCPEPLALARQLVLVTADQLASTTASVRRFERATPNAPWQADGGPVTALIGHNGLGWAHAFRAFARKGEPVKVEGDKRAPAGFFKIGRSFGFAASPRPNYLRIMEGMTCVDDLSSPAYNTITSRAEVGSKVHGENMWRVPEYRRGLLVDYPSDARVRGGSCVFIHLQLPGRTGTSGCVALPEPQLEALQDHVQAGAVLAILPRQALDRFKSCLPIN